MRVCLGGTFHPFHVGHEALLQAAMQGATEVFVGITDGRLAVRDRSVPPWKERAAVVKAFLRDEGFQGEVTVRALTTVDGPAATEDFDAIVVSPETAPGAHRINTKRHAVGLPLLRVRVVPHVLAADRLPVSATAIAEGRIDRTGKRLRPVEVVVGSANPVKVDGVEDAFQAFLGDTPCTVRGEQVISGVPEQPREAETLRGARARAEAACHAVPEADYWVGVEAGLHQDPGRQAWYDAQACVVLDRLGHVTDGWGPAFQYPPWVHERALAGEMVSEILGPVAGDPRIGGTTGAVGFLSDGLVDRRELTRIAVVMALVPRVRPELALPPED